jgi:hypothetical protein
LKLRTQCFELNVLRRSQHGRVRLTNHDRWFLIQLYRWFPSILKVLTIIPSENDAYEAWSDYSSSSAAGWLVLSGDDDDLFRIIETRAAHGRSGTTAGAGRPAGEHQMRHADDVARIAGICAARGVAVFRSAAYDAWCAYSETMAAGWIGLDHGDDEVFSAVSGHLPEPPHP